MDFIILGFGLGAIMMVGGIALRDLVPQSQAVRSDRLSWAEALKRRQRARWSRGGGRLLITLGAVVATLTLVLLLVDASDTTGLIWMSAILGCSIVFVAAWAGYYAWQQSPRQQHAPQLRWLNARVGRSGDETAVSSATTAPRSASRERLARRGPNWPVTPSPRQPSHATSAAAASVEPARAEQEAPAAAMPDPVDRSREVRPWLADGHAINWRSARGDHSSGDRQSPARQSSDNLAAGTRSPEPRPFPNTARQRAPFERDAAPSRQPRPADD